MLGIQSGIALQGLGERFVDASCVYVCCNYRLNETDAQRRRRLVADAERHAIERYGVVSMEGGGNVLTMHVQVERNKAAENRSS